MIRLVAAALCAVGLAAAANMVGADPRDATAVPAKAASVVELYQSQGCSSCPPANALLNRLADRSDLLVLSFAVTYWDDLGWKDTFARSQYTERQWDYARANGRANVATPQFIVNGKAIVSGSNPAELFAAIRDSGALEGAPAITLAGGQIRIGAAKAAHPATVWLVRYDPRERRVAVRGGENGGRTLPHRNIVVGLRRVGVWNGRPAIFDEPPYADAMQRSAILLQVPGGGPIIRAQKI